MRNSENIMNISDVYKYIIKIGEQVNYSAGPVIELSIFSHGWLKGPVLVNTYPDPPANDIDPRPNDFDEPRMKTEDLASFRKAFDKEGIVWCWGCAFEHGYNFVLDTILRNADYISMRKSTAVSKLAEEFEKLKINFDFTKYIEFVQDKTGEFTERIYKLDDAFFPRWTLVSSDPSSRRKDVLTFARTGKEIKECIMRGLDKTYFRVVANNLQRKCYGAFVGTLLKKRAILTKYFL